MIEALAANGSNHPLYIGSLPRQARRRQDFVDAHVSHLFSEIIPKESIAVAQQVAAMHARAECSMAGHPAGDDTLPNAGVVKC
jgi:hypothetical protein